MHPIVHLFRKDFGGFWRNRPAVILTFIVPLTLIWIFGSVFGVARKTPAGPSGVALGIVNESAAPQLETLITALEKDGAFRVIRGKPAAEGKTTPYTEAEVREIILSPTTSSPFRYALVLPKDALSDQRLGLHLKLLYNPRNDIESQMVLGLLEKNVYTTAPTFLLGSLRQQAVRAIGPERTDAFYDQLAGTVGNSFGLDPATIRRSMDHDVAPLAVVATATPAAGGTAAGPGTAAGGDVLSRIVQFEKEKLIAKAVRNPEATRSVGGWAVMFLLFSITGASSSLFAERDAGIFLRLLSMPVRPSHILWSKSLFNLTIGLIQLSVCFLAGWILFGVEIFSNWPVLLAACLCASAACTAFGMTIAALSNSPAVAQGLGTLVILSMSAVGGAWFPVSIMPPFMQTMAKFTLVYWAQESFVQALWAQATFVQILPTLGVLLLIAVVLNAVCLPIFRRGKMFR